MMITLVLGPGACVLGPGTWGEEAGGMGGGGWQLVTPGAGSAVADTHMVARETVRPRATLCRGRRGWHKVTRHKVPRHKVAGTRSWHKVAGTRFGPQKQTSSIQWVGSFRLVAPRGGQVLPLFENMGSRILEACRLVGVASWAN